MLTVLLRATYSDFFARLPSNGYVFFEPRGVAMNAAAIAIRVVRNGSVDFRRYLFSQG
jgi:hypothetical protein